MNADAADQPARKSKWVTSPHDRPRCPVHGERMLVRSGVGEVAYLRCPVNGCTHADKCQREPVRDFEQN